MVADLARLFPRRVTISSACALFVLLSVPALSSSVRYEYDSNGRLIHAYYDEPNGPIVDYTYDDNGNRETATVSNVARGYFRFSSSTYSVTESGGTVSVTVERVGGSFGAAHVTYATNDGSATVSGGDYVESHGELVWQSGNADPQIFTVSILNNSNIEATETFSVMLSGAAGATLGAPAAAGISILDDDGAAPGAPSFSNITSTSATATWSAGLGSVTEYRYRLNSGSWQSVGSALTVGLVDLSCATTYMMEIQAQYASGEWSAASSNSFATIDGCAPGAPGTPSISNITGTSATATWGPAVDNVAVTGYRYRLNGGQWQTLGNVLTVGLTALNCVPHYVIDVQARDAEGNWGPSSSKSFDTVDSCPPGAPGTPTISNITGTTATGSWGAATDNFGVTGYRYRLNGGQWQALGNVLTVGLTALNCVPHYVFDVQARDAAGNWGASSSKSFDTVDSCPPSAPGTPTISNITGTTATASWGAASDTFGVTGYRYRLNSGGWQVLGNVSSIALSGLICHTAYAFELEARDAAGNWGASNSTSFTTLDTCAPSTPGALAFSGISYTTAMASWGAATDNVGVTGYRYRLNGASTWQTLGNVTSVSLSGLSGASDYTFEVQARDAAGNWSSTRQSSFATLVPAITLSSPIQNTQSAAGGATAQLWFNSAGDIRKNMMGGSQQDIGDWLSPKTAMGSFELYATANTGSCSGSAMNTWLNLGSTVTWSKSVTGTRGTTASCAVNIQIRRMGTTTVLGSAVVVLVAVGT